MLPDLDQYPGLEEHLGAVYASEPFSGGNNPLWRLHGSKGTAILKAFGPAGAADTTARLQREIAYMDWLAACPDHPGKPVHASLLVAWPDQGACLMSEIPGIGQPTRQQALQAIIDGWAFLAAMPCTKNLPPARDNALSLSALAKQVKDRQDAFQAIDEPVFARFRDEDLWPLFETLAMPSDDDELSPDQQIASPSDMGPHNMVIASHGHMAWLDFEYAGRDDPANLVADCLLHEAAQWSPDERHYLLTNLPPAWRDDPAFQQRLSIVAPLVAATWIMIVLNPFRPDMRARLDTKGDVDMDQLCATRLARARHLVAQYQKHGFDVTATG